MSMRLMPRVEIIGLKRTFFNKLGIYTTSIVLGNLKGLLDGTIRLPKRDVPDALLAVGLKKPGPSWRFIESYLDDNKLPTQLAAKIRRAVIPPLKSKEKWQKVKRIFKISLPSVAFIFGALYLMLFYGECERREKLKEFRRLTLSERKFDPLKSDPGPPLKKIAENKDDFHPMEIGNKNLSQRTSPPTLFVEVLENRSQTGLEGIVSRAENPELNAESMMPNDPKTLPIVKTKESESVDDEQEAAIASQFSNYRLGISETYCKIYGVPVIDIPDRLKGKTVKVGILLGRKDSNPVPGALKMFSAVFYNSRTSARYSFWELLRDLPPQTIIDLEKMRAAYSYVMHFSEVIDSTSAIIASHHPAIHLSNLRILLRDDLMIEQNDLDPLDLWQDKSACHASGCAKKTEFEKLSSKHKSGVELWGERRNLPWWVWRLASYTKKYSLGRQGIGPSQIIISLAESAARDRDILKGYSAVLSEDDFKNEIAIVRAALDPKKAIYMRALTLDFVLKKLGGTVFLDQRVQYPADHPPFISNPKTAREFSLLNLAYMLIVYPDLDYNSSLVLIRNQGSIHLRHFAAGKIFGINPEYPGLFYVSVNLMDKSWIYFREILME